MAAEHRRIARGAVAAAIGAAPCAPALLEARRLHRRRLEHRGIGERDFVGDGFALGCEADRGPAEPGRAVAAVDERIEHEPEELVAHLECDLLAAGRGFAGELAQRIGEIAAGEAEYADEAGRQRAAVVEEAVERAGDVALVLAQTATRRAGTAVRFKRTSVGV